MNCPKCGHENSTEQLVKHLAKCPCDCHNETHLF